LVEFAANAPTLDLPATDPAPRELARAAERGAARGGSAKRTTRSIGVGFACAAAAAAWLALRPNERDGVGVRIKGSANLGFYVKRAGEVFEAGEGAALRPNDELRFRYSATQASWLAVLGIDAARRVSQYYPAGGGMRAIEAGRDVLLPEATRLDETLGDELVVGVFCESDRALPAVLQRLGSDPNAKAEPGCRLERIRITKTGSSQP
jgi:hypothetical protein